MKIKRTKELTIGELISAIFQVWGAGQAEKMVRLAIKTHMAVLRKPAHLFPRQRLA